MFSYLDLDGVVTIGLRTPPQQPVADHEAVGDEVLVLELDPGVGDEVHDGLVVHDDVAAALHALDHLAGALVHDLVGEVLRPALGAVQVTAL